MTLRAHRGARTFTRAKRANVWIGVFIDLVTVAASSKVLVGSLNAAALALRPFTIIRSRIIYQVETDQSAASEAARGAFGMIVVSDQALAAGVASIPGPTTNSDGEFFVWDPWITSFLFGDATGFTDPTGSFREIDSKAMRKVENNEDVALVMENAEATSGVNAQLSGRFLVKLH